MLPCNKAHNTGILVQKYKIHCHSTNFTNDSKSGQIRLQPDLKKSNPVQPYLELNTDLTITCVIYLLNLTIRLCYLYISIRAVELTHSGRNSNVKNYAVKNLTQ